MVIGPSRYRGSGADPGDRTRTTAIPGPQASVTSDQRWSEWRDSNPHPKAWKARRQPLPHIRFGSTWAHTQAEHGPVPFTGPTTSVGCQRPRSCEHVRFRTARVWRQRPSEREAIAPGEERTNSFRALRKPRTWTLELWRLRCFRYTTLPTSVHGSTASKTEPPCDLARFLLAGLRQKQKGLLGDRPRRPGSR